MKESTQDHRLLMNSFITLMYIFVYFYMTDIYELKGVKNTQLQPTASFVQLHLQFFVDFLMSFLCLSSPTSCVQPHGRQHVFRKCLTRWAYKMQHNLASTRQSLMKGFNEVFFVVKIMTPLLKLWLLYRLYILIEFN